LGSFATRFELGGGLAQIARVAMGRALVNDDGTNGQAEAANMIGGLLGFLALGTGFVDHNEGRRITGKVEEISEFGQRFEGEEMWLDRDDDNVGQTSCFGGVGPSMWRGIDDQEFDTLRLGLGDGSAQARGVGGHDPRKLVFAAIGPFGRGRLRVGIDHGRALAFEERANGKGQGNGGFPDPSFLGNDSNYIHVCTYRPMFVCSLVRRRW